MTTVVPCTKKKDNGHEVSPVRYIIIFCGIFLYGTNMLLRNSLSAITDAILIEFKIEKEEFSLLASSFFYSLMIN